MKLLLILLFSSIVYSFEVGECVKVKRKSGGGLIFKIHSVDKKNGQIVTLNVRANQFILGQSYLDTKPIKGSLVKYLEKVDCENGLMLQSAK